MAGLSWAQEAEEREEQRAVPRRSIRVLENPYDLASFYRAAPPSYDYFGPELVYGDPSVGSGLRHAGGPYPIASFYRQGGGGRYAAFWQTGYQAPGGYGRAYSNSIGENGDLFLFAPTFLAPIGPLTGAFFK
jgi:hypothetical protein